MDTKEGALRVWHIPQIPGKAFHVPVSSPAEAKQVLKVLADYDLFQLENNIKPDYSNAGGLEVFEGGEWVDWECPETLCDIDEWSPAVTHPTNTAILTDAEIEGVWNGLPQDAYPLDFARALEARFIEKLGASVEVPTWDQASAIVHGDGPVCPIAKFVYDNYSDGSDFGDGLRTALAQARQQGREEARAEFGADRWIDKDQPICVAVLYMEGDDPLIFAVSGRTTVWALEKLNADLKDNAGDYFDQGDGDYIFSGVWCSDSDGPIGYELDLIRYSPMAAARQPTQKEA